MIRDATPHDIPALVALGEVMHDESPRFRALTFDGVRLARTLASVIDGAAGFAMVAEKDGEIVGGLCAMVTPHWSSPDLCGCDLALFVRPDARGSLFPARLVRAYVAWAKGLGVKDGHVLIGVMTGVHVESTVALLERLGGRRAGVVMEF
jgi:GNAT superfamily N-acetyltransferase